jgi:hypothetical protein
VCVCVCVCVGEEEILNSLEGRYLQTLSYAKSTVE